MLQYTYLLINFFTVIICFVFSFHHKIKFNRHFGAFIKASLLVGFVFVLWDIWFTRHGVWWFNYRYLIGFKISELPIEEIMFFICIPFSCVFTYFCLDKFFKLDWKPQSEKIFVTITSILFVAIALFYHDRIYTFVTFLTSSVSLLLLYFVLKIKWMGKATVIYLLLMPGFLSVNGILTGTGLDSPIVNYNPQNFIGFRILTIPIEDVFYGYEMILWNLFFFYKFKGKESEPNLETASI